MTTPAAPATYRVQTGAIQWYETVPVEADPEAPDAPPRTRDILHAYGYNAEITEAEAGPDFLRLVATTALVPVNVADLAPALDAFYRQFDHAPAPVETAAPDPVQQVADATGVPVEAVRTLRSAVEDNPNLTEEAKSEIRAWMEHSADAVEHGSAAFVHPDTVIASEEIPA